MSAIIFSKLVSFTFYFTITIILYLYILPKSLINKIDKLNSIQLFIIIFTSIIVIKFILFFITTYVIDYYNLNSLIHLDP